MAVEYNLYVAYCLGLIFYTTSSIYIVFPYLSISINKYIQLKHVMILLCLC